MKVMNGLLMLAILGLAIYWFFWVRGRPAEPASAPVKVFVTATPVARAPTTQPAPMAVVPAATPVAAATPEPAPTPTMVLPPGKTIIGYVSPLTNIIKNLRDEDVIMTPAQVFPVIGETNLLYQVLYQPPGKARPLTTYITKIDARFISIYEYEKSRRPAAAKVIP